MTLRERLEYCAAIAHEANRIYCQAIGDSSQAHYEDAPEWQRSSAFEGVKAAISGNTPEQLHEGWMAIKLGDGWVYGPVKDAEKKTHPCLVPYADLPVEQRAKDLLFQTVVMAMVMALPSVDTY